MLTPQQKLLLKTAATTPDAVRNDEIEKTTNLIKAINPAAFHSASSKKVTSSMKLRKFFDEPTTLAPEDYAAHVVHYNQSKQHEVFARRSAKLLKL